MNSHADAKSWRDSTAIALGFALFVLHSFADLTSTQALSSALQGVSLAFGGMAIASAWQQRFRWLAALVAFFTLGLSVIGAEPLAPGTLVPRYDWMMLGLYMIMLATTVSRQLRLRRRLAAVETSSTG